MKTWMKTWKKTWMKTGRSEETRANTLRDKIEGIVGGEYMDIVDDSGYVFAIESMDTGWRLYSDTNSFMVKFDTILVSGNDLYLAIDDAEGEQKIFATLDATKFEEC